MLGIAFAGRALLIGAGVAIAVIIACGLKIIGIAAAVLFGLVSFFIVRDDLFKLHGDAVVATVTGLQVSNLCFLGGNIFLSQSDLVAQLYKEALGIILVALVIELADLGIGLTDNVLLAVDLQCELGNAADVLGLIGSLISQILGGVCCLADGVNDFALEVIEEKPKIIKEKVSHVLDLVGLSEKANDLPEDLSGGEQQRVAIARAIVNRPTVLIADEPTGNLDPDTSKDIVELFKHINNFGTTVIMVTHNMDLVSYLNKRVIRLKDGRVQSDNMRGAEINEA